MHGLDLLKKGVIWRVADGTKIKIWRHHWLPRAWSLSTIGSKRPCRLKWVSQLIRDGSREWNKEILERFFHRNDIDEILKIKLPWWHYEKTGCFSVRSAYRLGMDWKEIGTTTSSSSNTNGERMVWKKLWALQLHPKVKVFAWKLAHNGLATQSNKVPRRMTEQSTCLIYGGKRMDIMKSLCARMQEPCVQQWGSFGSSHRRINCLLQVMSGYYGWLIIMRQR